MLIPEVQKIVERESGVRGFASTGYLKILSEFAEMVQSATAKRCAEIADERFDGQVAYSIRKHFGLKQPKHVGEE